MPKPLWTTAGSTPSARLVFRTLTPSEPGPLTGGTLIASSVIPTTTQGSWPSSHGLNSYAYKVQWGRIFPAKIFPFHKKRIWFSGAPHPSLLRFAGNVTDPDSLIRLEITMRENVARSNATISSQSEDYQTLNNIHKGEIHHRTG